jgi:CPA2 family monovalent cation:H+ antiporter-2
MHGSTEVIRQARLLNPGVRVFGRTAYVKEMAALREWGAEQVFSGEGEVALALTVALLRDLGATPDQIDRERDRVRAELLGLGAAPAESAPGPTTNASPGESG